MERIHPYERSVAVIGSGVAGLVAAYALSARNRVTLFEADTRIGGHAHTHYVDRGDGYTVGVDSAFLVHNDRTYPTLCRLFAELGIATRETDMSMSVRDDGSGLEYAGARGIGGLFPSWSVLTRPRYLRMLAEIKRFHAAATRLLQTDTDETVGEFVERHGFSRYFVDHFMTPLVAAVWSCPPGEAMRYPARYLFVFLGHHGMLSVFGSPRWRTIVGGSANYVEAILTRIDEVHAGDPVTSVRRVADGVEVTGGATRVFDAAAIATHPDQALLMLAEPTAVERPVLGAIPYCTNHAQLHTDESVLPRHRRARASWNYLVTPNDDSVLVTYDVTRLMRLVAAAPRAVAQAFADEVRAVRETMAVVSAATAVEPPEALRDRLLTDVSTAPVVELRRKPWRTTILAAAAALVIGLGALGVGLALRPAPAPSTAEQVFAASDVRTVSGQILTGGTATVVFSREKNAGVLVMNNVAPPAPGTVYQMWLIGDKGPESAGTMDAKAVGPSTTAVLPDLGSSKALAFTVEPPGGSAQPTSPVFAQLPLA